MDNVLFVMNVQECYAGKSRNTAKYSYEADELIRLINKRIGEYEAEAVFYIKSVARGLGAMMSAYPKAASREAEFPAGLKVRSKNIYEKNKPDCFTNDALVDFMRARNVKQIELVGIDTGTDMGASAFTATEDMRINIVYNEVLIKSFFPEKAAKYREKLRKNRVSYMTDWTES